MSRTSKPIADNTNGFSSTSVMPSTPAAVGSDSTRPIRCHAQPSAPPHTTVRMPSATTGCEPPAMRVTSVKAPRSSTFSGDVAEFAGEPGMMPHSPCSARFFA